MKRIIVLCSIFLLLVPLTALAQEIDYCEGDFDYDQDQDGTDAFTFKTDFGRSKILDPCPPDGPAPVARTAQTISYAPGDDGDLGKGVAWPNPRFTDNGDGTVTDNLTGLIWLQDARCYDLGPRRWNDALAECYDLQNGQCGLADGSRAGDWRLPNYKELFSLVDAENHHPALPTGHPFTNVQSYYYWSSTTSAVDTDYAWFVIMTIGGPGVNIKSSDYYAWPVRGGRTTSRPLVTITQPTTQPTYSTEEDYITLAGTASDDVGIVGVTWSNSRGGSGTASGTTAWIISDIYLPCGADNIITVTAEDTDANTGSDVLTVDVKPCPPGL